MTTFETIDTRIEGRIGILTFNRPKVLNAINRQLMAEVTAAVSEFTKDFGPRSGCTRRRTCFLCRLRHEGVGAA